MKKTLKNIIVIALISSILFALSGCGKKEENLSEDNNATQGNEQKTPEFSMGEWKDNVYSNDFLGLKFNLPEGWEYSNDEEIAEMMNIGTELLNDDQKVAAEISKLTSAYYMVANDPNTGNSVTIVSEKPAIEVTTDYYINQLKTQLTSVESINYEIGETSKETVANIECDTLAVTASMSGHEIAQKYYLYKIDKYFVSIIVTSTTGETTINDIIKSFE